jgi:proteasome lid subunit RPN8/RPN11
MRLALPEALRAQILDAARAVAPRECCGLVLGRRGEREAAATALHPARNLAADARRFAIDPADHIAAQKAARAAGLAVIGCYHSHPGGPPAPSAADLAGAGEEGLFWLIAAGGRLAAFVYENGGFSDAEVAQTL